MRMIQSRVCFCFSYPVILLIVLCTYRGAATPNLSTASLLTTPQLFKIDTSLFANLTLPQLPLIDNLYRGLVTTPASELGYTLLLCQKAKSLSEVKNFPLVFWIDDVASSSQLSFYLQTGPFRLIKQSTDGRYHIQLAPEETKAIFRSFSLVHIDLTGVGMSPRYATSSKMTNDSNQSAMQLSQVIKGVLTTLQLSLDPPKIFLAARKSSAIITLKTVGLLSSSNILVSGMLLVNSVMSSQAILNSVAEHLYNLGLIDTSQRSKIQSKALIVKNLLKGSKNSTEAIQSYEDLWNQIKNITGAFSDAYSYIDESIVERWFNEAQVKRAYDFNSNFSFKAFNNEQRRQTVDLLPLSLLSSLKQLLNSFKIKVAFVQGQVDLETNPLSANLWAQQLKEWDASRGLQPYKIGGARQKVAGFSKFSNDLSMMILMVTGNGKYISSDQEILGNVLGWMDRA